MIETQMAHLIEDQTIAVERVAHALEGMNNLASERREAPHSIELQRAKDGTYYWTAKCYFAPGEEDTALQTLERIDASLRASYLSE